MNRRRRSRPRCRPPHLSGAGRPHARSRQSTAGCVATRSGCSWPSRGAAAPALPRPAAAPAARRPAGGEQLGNARRGARRTSSTHGAVVVHVGTRLDVPAPHRCIGRRAAHRARRRPPVLDAEIGEEIHVAGGVRFRLVAPYPRDGASPTGRGNRLWRARVTGTDSPGGPSGRSRPPDRLRLPDRAIPARRLPDGVRHAPWQRRDAQRRKAVHPRAGHPADRRRRRRRADHPAHRPVVTGRRRAPQPEWFEVSGGHGAARATRCARAAGASIAVGTTAVRALETADARAVSSTRGPAGRSSSSPRTGRCGPSTG